MARYQTENALKGLGELVKENAQFINSFRRRVNENRRLSLEAKAEEMANYKRMKQDAVYAKLEQAKKSYEETRRQVYSQVEAETTGFIPKNADEAGRYMVLKDTISKRLATMRPDKMMEEYNKALEYGQAEKVAAYESEIPYICSQHHPDQLPHVTSIIQQRQEDRITDSTKKDLEFLEANNSTVNAIDRALVSYDQSEVFSDGALYSILVLTNTGGPESMQEIKNAYRRPTPTQVTPNAIAR